MKPKRKTWREKHNEECDALRASVGAKVGDGLKLIKQMQSGTETQKELAKSYRDMSSNMADAIASLYASNTTLALLMKYTGAENGRS